MTEKKEHIKNILALLPDTPGVYQYFDKEGKIIYVGKAKNLKRRVSSYFNKTHDSIKTNVLVKNICDIKYIVVKSEEDALHLENSLIKEYKPRYNVLLKDDKTYPWITIKNEHFPRIFLTRKIIKDGSKYYGPYANVHIAKTVLELIRDLFPIRTCHLALTPENIKKKKFKVCLQYHIKNCKGPCENYENETEYMEYISQIRQILNGNTQQLCDHLVAEMQKLSSELKFEEAQSVKEKYLLIEKYRAKSVIVSTTIHNTDVFSYDEDGNSAFVNYLHIRNGSIVQSFTIEFKKRLNEAKEDILALGIAELRTRFKSLSKEIIVPFLPDLKFENAEFIVPQRGDKRKLLEISEQNVKQYKIDKLKQSEKMNPEQKSTRLMKEIQKELGLQKLPLQIECFDNSNIQGSDAVAACVVFKKARPSKKDYRKYIIKTVNGPDDYASMQEVVRRRYQRAIDEGTTLPDLIITDGGKGQMEVVRKVVEDELHLNIPIAGLAKDNRHRTSELLFGFPPLVIGLKQQTPLFHLMEQIQNEVHRFAISFHRDKRSKSQVTSELDTIKGIGPQTKNLLLTHYKSVKRLREASLNELTELIGSSKANTLINALQKKKE
ncbi:uvrABC system protein C [Tannerella sp. CAG:118]|uniref:UvrABC system protein C n=1 Tax=Coprobacter secundus subsp. similis TaxID=2751153 RepID=A0A7G1HWB6_9BACT|nr:UvrABC system protein C [Coprobacter secundus subsp. similis]CCY38856.1 uvrABC system protein C [Tannerella sp. CAG:118]